jgi:microcin C transport system ATP-binding protein
MSQKKTILSVNDLCVSFIQGDKHTHIVKNISFDVQHNTTVALVGESGSGKSLTAHAIMRLLPYPVAYHPSGEIWFSSDNDVCARNHEANSKPQELLSRSLKSMTAIRGHDIGMIFQEPMSALNPLQTIEAQIGESVNLGHCSPDKAASQKKLSKNATREQVLALLRQVHIVDPESKLKSHPHELSGGQRQRVMIAMALANRPKLLIADEPTTALDVTVQKEILDLLKELQQQYQMSILLITHDLGVVKYLADEVLVMQHGEIVERGDTQTVLHQPQNDYTKLLVDSHPKGEPVELQRLDGECSVVVETKHLNVIYSKNKPMFGKCKDFFIALEDINFKLHEGRTLGVLGESGSGKSTLALAILKLIQSRGVIELEGRDISALNENQVRPLRCAMQVVFQDPFSSLSPRMSAKQIISEGLHLQNLSIKKESIKKESVQGESFNSKPTAKQLCEADIDKMVDAIMIEVGLDPETKHRYPHEFSGGQRQRIAIARAFILNPRLVFLDEPTSALDRAVQMQVINLLRKLQQQRKLSYVFISHDIHVVKAMSHKVMVIKSGEVVEHGDAKDVLENPQHPYTQKLLQATLD